MASCQKGVFCHRARSQSCLQDTSDPGPEFCKTKPIDEIKLGTLEEEERKGKAFEMEME